MSEEPVTDQTQGPTCQACPAPAVVQWQRRLTPDEIAAHLEAEESLRAWALHEADPASPPILAPLPTEAETARTVRACAQHGISLDAAALIHAAVCTAPTTSCNCTPEQPVPDAPPPPAAPLPPGWTA